MPAGRPSNYEPRFAQIAEDLMSEGASIIEVCAHLRIWPQQCKEWREKYPEFGDAIELGKKISKGVWMKMGRENLSNKNFNYQGWYMNMKNRFDWCDKREQKHSITVKQEDSLNELK